MKSIILFLSLLISYKCLSQMPVTDAAANTNLVLINKSLTLLNNTERQELMQLRELVAQTKSTVKNTYKIYEESKRSANFLDKLYELSVETESILEGETKLADTLKYNEAHFLKQVSNLCSEASKAANQMASNNKGNNPNKSYQMEYSKSEIFLSEIGYLLNKAIECRKMAGIQSKEVPLTPYERFNLKTQADNFMYEASNKINEFKTQLVTLNNLSKQLNTQSEKKVEKQQNTDYSKIYNIEQPVIGNKVKN